MHTARLQHPFTIRFSKAPIALLLVAVCAATALVVVLVRRSATGVDLHWKAVDGRWSESNGIISVLTYGRGDMQVGGDERWTDYRIAADLRYDLLFPETHYGDAGLGVRVSDASEGVDSYRGYYAGIRADGQTVFFGRADYGWHELAEVRMLKPVRLGEWYHMQVTLRRCEFLVEVTDPAGQRTTLAYNEPHCKTSGAVSLRSFYAQSSWKNVVVTQLRD